MTVNFDPVPQLAWTAPPAGPAGAFGPVAALLHACTGGEPLRRPRLVAFGADHGVSALDVSAHPDWVTQERLAALAGGRGSLAAAADAAGTGVRAVDLTPGAGFPAAGRIDIEDAMDADLLDRALTAGKDAADAEVDAGADLLIGTVLSVSASTPAAVLAASITGMEPVDTTSRGSGIDDAAWIRKAAAVRDALFRASRAGAGVTTLLRVAGGPDIAALTAFLAQAAVRRTPVLVDDVISTACAVLAHRLAPGADAYVISAGAADERSQPRLLEVLGREPLASWSLRAGGGRGALMMVPVLRSALLLVPTEPSDPSVPEEDPAAVAADLTDSDEQLAPVTAADGSEAAGQGPDSGTAVTATDDLHADAPDETDTAPTDGGDATDGTDAGTAGGTGGEDSPEELPGVAGPRYPQPAPGLDGEERMPQAIDSWDSALL
ncbi:nicotinate-nucleotide--dimethylbenzimidazole phosphoribosyltransferase [Nakamurella sp. YIM 132087]|uniref:Nicotinate-nucleotide--dimethylbenzimidazole phosphoribosyltransferase n=1 Tax=Nakamurella alba TaxID=2665158 RepID=A0A7K1FGD7_9ACTN|nr:nicotinate-nucleotide--dimethylbenzimidazole phosphoribosyltransferase [Nakamurella alba]MTD13120.1 nicotinate-nucleotide--dimethylbenzimidazole phosphoribosyltransferase [Nakamurella alba]